MGQLGDSVWTAQGSLGCEKEQRRKGGLGGSLLLGRLSTFLGLRVRTVEEA